MLWNGPETAPVTVLLAHGAGAAMDAPPMLLAAEALAARGLRVARFEFGYMAARRTGGSKAPPPRADRLIGEYRAAVDAMPEGPLIIGGKSMGGRVATMLADELYDAGRIAGALCLGYPFHPPAQPDKLRTGHLATLRTPTLICQGTRDPFGTRQEVKGYALSDAITLLWVEDGDHHLKPRIRETGRCHASAISDLALGIAEWAVGLV